MRFIPILGLCLMGFALPSFAFGPFWYRAEPIEMWVVDEGTNAPIEGVVAVAHWQLDMGTLGGYSPIGQLMIMETVTDAKGRVYFPGWGPKFAAVGVLQPRRPSVILFKQGYRYEELNNFDEPDTDEATTVRKFIWSGKTVKLERYKGSVEEYAKHLSNLNISLGFAYDSENCEWKLVPRMLAALLKEEASFTEKRIYNSLQRISVFSGPKEQKKCGSAKDFFREYLK